MSATKAQLAGHARVLVWHMNRGANPGWIAFCINVSIYREAMLDWIAEYAVPGNFAARVLIEAER